MFFVFVLLFIFIVISVQFRLYSRFFTLVRECYYYLKFHVYRHKLLRTMNSAGECDRDAICPTFRVCLLTALNLAASMFDSASAGSANTADSNGDLYILGIKYNATNGTNQRANDIRRFWRSVALDAYAINDDVISRFWFTYRTGFAPIGRNRLCREDHEQDDLFANLGGPSGPTKDTGWGCMMRCGQMMFSEAYLRFFLPAGRCT